MLSDACKSLRGEIPASLPDVETSRMMAIEVSYGPGPKRIEEEEERGEDERFEDANSTRSNIVL